MNQSAHEPLTLRVSGMDCGGCERKVETALARHAGVVDVAANSVSGTVQITPAEHASLDQASLAETLSQLGYPLVQKTAETEDKPPWWQTKKGRLVIVTGALLLLALGAVALVPSLGHWPFMAATLAGLVPIVKSAWRGLLARQPFTIEMLMSIAALGALAIGAAAEAAVVVFLFAVGELLEGVAAAQARRTIASLSRLTPSTARLLESGEQRRVDAATLAPGQQVMVRGGDLLPCDGEVLEGASSVDESPITGESIPREVSVGSELYAGSVNLDAALTVRVTRGAADNTIARVVRLVEEAQASKAPVARFIDRFARWYMPAIVVVALLVALLPPLFTGLAWSESLYRALALLLIACPCALVISTPAAIAAGLATAARNGLLIKGGAVLEQLGGLKRIALDKTGTLTAGRPSVTDVQSVSALGVDEVLGIAAALEQTANHPLAEAIVKHARSVAPEHMMTAASGVKTLPGAGIEGMLNGQRYVLASPRHIAEHSQALAPWATRVEALEAQGNSVVLLVQDGTLLGMIALRDEPREDARAGIRALQQLGIEVVMLSGDNPQTVRAVGEGLGIEAHGALLPDQKAQWVDRWQAEGLGPVGKVGDGINDAPALAAADVGIAMGGGTDVALETADAALLKNRLTGVAELVALSRATLANVKVNVALALGFKALFLVTTVLGMTGMWLAVMADTGATVLVTLNALRLLGWKSPRFGESTD